MVPRTKTLPGTQTNSAKEHGEIAQQCSQSKTFEDLKIQRTIFIHMFRVQKQDWNQISRKNFSYPNKRFEWEERSFFLLGLINGLGYTAVKLEVMCIVSFVKILPIISLWMTSEWNRNFELETCKKYWKGFHQHESSNCYQKAIQKTDSNSKLNGWCFWNGGK